MGLWFSLFLLFHVFKDFYKQSVLNCVNLGNMLIQESLNLKKCILHYSLAIRNMQLSKAGLNKQGFIFIS